MVSKELTKDIDKGIRQAQKLVSEMPEFLRTRTIELKIMPNEVISRIKQVNGIIVEFEERS